MVSKEQSRVKGRKAKGRPVATLQRKAEKAQEYIQRRFRITLCNGKKPTDKNWGQIELTVEEIRRRLDKNPSLNLGVVLGPASGIVDVECDSPQAEKDFKRLFRGVCHSTPAFMSQRGKHRLFGWNPRLTELGRAVVKSGELEIRIGGDSKAVQSLLPPSETNGCERRWCRGATLNQLEIRPFPDEIVDRLLEARNDKRSSADNGLALPLKERQKIDEGYRHATLVKIAGAMRAAGMTVREIDGGLQHINAQRCKPPLSEPEIHLISGSFRKYPIGGETPNRKVTLDDVHQEYRRNLRIEDFDAIDLILATLASVHYPDDPLWLGLVAESGSGKTEYVRPISSHSDVYRVTTMTCKSMGSNFVGPDGKRNYDVLREFHQKCVLILDFTTLTESKHADELFAQLRSAYDARYDSVSGVGTSSTQSKFNMLICSTAVIEEYTALAAKLGTRFVLYRLRVGDPIRLARKAVRKSKEKQDSREKLASVVGDFLASMPRRRPTISEKLQEGILRLADFAAHARGVVPRDESRRIIRHPEIEVPSRLAQQLQRTAMGLAMIRGKRQVTEAEFRVIRKMCLDSLQTIRRECILILHKERGWIGGETVVEEVKLSPSLTREALEDLTRLEVLDCVSRTKKPGERSSKSKKSGKSQAQGRPPKWYKLKHKWINGLDK